MQLLKRLTAFFLIIAVLSQTLSIGVTLLDFRVNRQYYEELCINKNRPELACQGKCVLMQSIENQVNMQHENDTNKLKNIIEQDDNWIFEINRPLSINDLFDKKWTLKSPNFIYLNAPSRLREKGVFHPPLS